ncbi:MAG: LCP family protein [Actinobacteria bacterium]|nr:LCP family protein [Actinomycetota bacterium]
MRAEGLETPPRHHGALALLIVTFLLLGSYTLAVRARAVPDVVVGVPEAAATPAIPSPPSPPPTEPTGVQVLGAQAAGPPSPPVAVPAGQPWPEALPFEGAIPVPENLVFVLAIGSDARPGQDPTSARGDSLHLLAVNPASGQGTIVGFPRDSWVDVPGHGRQKINSALALGGPDLMAQTVRQLTGLPVHYYVVTGFEGFQRLVDDLGGVDIPVPYRMNDKASSARFEAGWNRLGGAGALAFSRNRKDTPQGDLSRSANQGVVILSALAKMRGEVGDDGGLLRWVDVLLRHVRLDVPLGDLPRLASLARRLDPARVQNVVVPGTPGSAGRQSVVHLDAVAAANLFTDLRDDAVIGAAEPATTTSTSTSTSTSTTAPPADPPPG